MPPVYKFLTLAFQCCAAGTSGLDISQSLDMVFRVADGLRDSAVDDTHLSSRWGDLIEGIANRLKSRLACPPISQAHGVNSSPSAAEMDTSHGANDQTFRPQYSIGCSIGQTREARPENEPIDPFDPGPSRSVDGKRDHHLDAWSMWWDDQFSQVNLNHMSWYPTLGLLDGSDLSLSGETTGGAFSNSGSFY